MFASFASLLPSSNPLAFSEQQPQPFKQDFQTDDKLANEVTLFQSYVFKLTTSESMFDHLHQSRSILRIYRTLKQQFIIECTHGWVRG